MNIKHIDGIEACVFDAYGTLFDFNSAALAASDELGGNWQSLSELWRQKQLQYTWLRGLAGRHADFWQVTGDALDFALNTLGIDHPDLRARLMDLYLHLGCYPEVPETLRRLQAAGMKLAILSNGTPAMLAAVVRHSALENIFDAIVSGGSGRLQATPGSLRAGLRTPATRPGSDLLPLVERVGCLFGQGLRPAGPVVQPLRTGTGTDSRNTGWRDQGSLCSTDDAVSCASR
jgi:2-haloalkanoic acid dehalogenase type II